MYLLCLVPGLMDSELIKRLLLITTQRSSDQLGSIPYLYRDTLNVTMYAGVLIIIFIVVTADFTKGVKEQCYSQVFYELLKDYNICVNNKILVNYTETKNILLH